MYNPKLRFGLWGGVSIYVYTLSTLLGSLLLLSSHAFTMTGSGVLETRGGTATTRKGMWFFFLGKADSLCPRALMAIHRAYCDDGSGPLVMATGGGREGGDPAAFVVVATPHVVVSAPVVVVVAHRLSPFPNVTKCLTPDLCLFFF